MKKTNVRLKEEIIIYYLLILELCEKFENSLTYKQIEDLFNLCLSPYEKAIKDYIYNIYIYDSHFNNIFKETILLLNNFDNKGKYLFSCYEKSNINNKGKIIKGKEDNKVYKNFINKKKEINKYLINIENINRYLEQSSSLDSNYVYEFLSRFLKILKIESIKHKNINNKKINGYKKNKKILEDNSKKYFKRQEQIKDKKRGFNLFNWK